MKKWFFLLLLHSGLGVQAQFCTTDNRFSETAFFQDTQINAQYNITYGNAPDWNGNMVALKMDVYYPALNVDTLPLRPLIMMVHGGGLISGDKVNYTRVCREFAKRGFVAATINYRLGVDCLTDSISEEKAKYRAQQDIHAAFRYVVQNAALLRVDTSWLFIGGGSAGSVAALGVVYLDQAEWNLLAPGVQPLLGNLNSSGNALTNTFQLKGIFNDWGAMLKANMQPAEMLPTVSFHGDADSTVNIDSAYGGGCVQAALSYGSRAMHNLLLANGVCSDLSVKPGGGHGVYQDSVYGTPFRVGRAACFFKSLFCNTCTGFYQADSVAASCTVTGIAPGAGSNNAMQVFPNPFTDKITVTNTTGSDVFTLHNAYGQCIYRGTWPGTADLSALPPGMYILSTIGTGGTRTWRLFK